MKQYISILLTMGSLAAIAVAVAYTISEPAKGQIDDTIKEATTWTPERIAADPTGYLNWAERQAQRSMRDLDAEQHKVAQQWNAFERDQTAVDEKIAIGKGGLTELKKIYRGVTDDANLSFPYPYEGVYHDERWYKESIVNLDEEVDSLMLDRGYISAGIKRLDVEVGKIEKMKATAKGQQRDIAVAKRELSLGKIAEGISGRLENINAAMGSLKVRTDDILTTKPLSVDSLVDQQKYSLSFDEGAFAEIMAGDSL